MQETKERRRPPYRTFIAWMVVNDVTRKELIDLLGLSDSTLSHRLNGTGADFAPGEIRTLVKTYGADLKKFFYF